MDLHSWREGAQSLVKGPNRTRRAMIVRERLVLLLTCLSLLAACGSSGDDLSKIGAATYRGPANTAQPPGQKPAGSRDAEATKSSKKGLAAPVEPSALASGAEAVGNAFYINNAGQLLTTWGQVRNCRRVAILDNFELRHVTVIAGNPLSGLAILDAKDTRAIYAHFRATLPGPGESVTAFVHPISDGLLMPLEPTKGVMRSPTGAEGTNAILQTTAFHEGQSAGGPIVDERGNVLGVTVAKLSPDWPGEIGYGISIEMILRFTASATVGIWASEVGGQDDASAVRTTAPYAGDYTVPIICFR
jgi:S1-C subfamily serine protease